MGWSQRGSKKKSKTAPKGGKKATITGKQRAARKRNIKIAQNANRTGGVIAGNRKDPSGKPMKARKKASR